jgi:hypothetical protein
MVHIHPLGRVVAVVRQRIDAAMVSTGPIPKAMHAEFHISRHAPR